MMPVACVFVCAEMWRAWLILFLLLPVNALSSQPHSGLWCVNDYVTTITCVWNTAAWFPGQNCHVTATRETFDGIKNTTCSLHMSRSCSINTGIKLSFSERFPLYVFCNETKMDGVEKYHPGHHVKLHPPDQLKLTGNNLTWNRGAHFPKSITAYGFQLEVKAIQHGWQERSETQSTFFLFDGDMVCWGECEVRVRVKPIEPTREDQIRGEWSDWSPAVTWRSETSSTIHNVHTFLTSTPVIGALSISAVFTFILLIFIPVFIYRHKCGLKAMGREHVPDPSKYFQPLITEHKGNFQQWVGPQHTSSLFLPLQSDCEISPVDEVSEALDDSLAGNTLLIYANSIMVLQHQMSGGSQLSSGVSNRGYFYSEHQPGSVCVDSCSVYFTYHPEGGVLQSSMSYERLREPSSPDSGFGLEAEKEEADEEEKEHNADKEQKKEYSGVNMQHHASFVLSLPESTGIIVPPSFVDLTPWHEEPESSGISMNDEPLNASAVRPSSMVVQPCSSGYLTLKEMQKYSNKSI